MNWLTNKGNKDALREFTLLLVTATAIYCINPSNVDFSVHTWFHRERTIYDLVRQKDGL